MMIGSKALSKHLFGRFGMVKRRALWKLAIKSIQIYDLRV